MIEELNGKGTEQELDNRGDAVPNQRVAELEQMVAAKDIEIAILKKSADEFKEQLSMANESLAEATQRYKARIIQMHSGITEELVNGDTIEAIDKSLEKALTMIGQVRKSVEKEISNERIPAGAPGRQVVDISTLSAREKIQYAIGGNR